MMRVCGACHTEKPLSEFYKALSNKDGVNKRCKVCISDYGKAYRKKNPQPMEVRRKSQLWRDYGLTLEQYEIMFEEQKGCCAICGGHQSSFDKKLCVDHSHDTGDTRGLLCLGCNTRLGVIENKEFVTSANLYLERYNEI